MFIVNTKVGNQEYESVQDRDFENMENIAYNEYDPEQEEQYDIQQYINNLNERQEAYLWIMREFSDCAEF